MVMFQFLAACVLLLTLVGVAAVLAAYNGWPDHLKFWRKGRGR
jgi:hypothetical protein